MTATVDRATCVGCGLCADTCPEVFKMEGDVAVAIAGTVPAGVADSCREAADGCPVSAISVAD